MLFTILAGCDLSVQSDAALERAVALCEQNKARLVLVHALADDAGAGPGVANAMLDQLGEVAAAVRAEEATRLAAKVEAIRARGLTTELLERKGPAAEVIAAVATELGADLVVLGTHGHGGVERILLGSVAAAVVHTAPCDVLVVRGAAVHAVFAKAMVATDFSPAAEKALEHTDDFVLRGSPIELVHAWQLPSGSWGATLLGAARFPWSTVRDAVLAGAREQADALVAKRAASGHAIEVELVQGPPAEVIARAAEEGGYDLIAVGAHGHRGFRRLLVGSVADSTIRHAPCSVLVVHGASAPR